MAKKAKKAKRARKARRARKKVVDKVFLGNLHSVTKAINAAAKVVEKGRKQAVAAVAKGTAAPIGTPAHNDLAFNKEALKKADQLLDGFRSAKAIMLTICCNNDENCNFVVRVTLVKKPVR